MPAPNISMKELRRVVLAAAVGNIIEWYDFYIFGSLASILAVKFFEKSHPVAAFLSTVALFPIGFLIRPLGAFVFGWLGDKVGRKYTFLVTLSGMGLSTAVIGIIPTYAQIGLAAAVILFVLRLIQGAYASAGSMAVPSPTWPSTSQMRNAGITLDGSRRRPRSGSSSRWR
jgi:MFS family permease